ncbi:hypothetical protein OEZ85_002990 [Tetradesmus obliquus]|uniref:DUF4056 domain-containing protein n=1 Tax=Tetradesmus obliquus TaxID=3088 RepID=A0ABY8TZS6_TETOB|nr:hypothetical protein OEZ85_002990 [Tetradesmus obliquus]
MACAVVAAANTTPDTTGGQIEHAPGYTFGSKVGGYLRLSTDICDIKSTIGTSDNPPYAEARKIYLDGKNSYKNDGTIRTLRELATKSYAGEPVFDMYAEYFGTAAFLDQPVSFAFAGDAPYLTVPQRNETIVKGLESALQTVYLLHELDEAADKIRDRKLSAADGAPHNIDETWAIYVGERPDCSLWGASHKRAREFGTMQDCNTSKVNAAMLAAHRAMYKAASDGDLAAFNAQVAEVQRLFLITYIQATLKYAELMDRAVAAKDQETLQADQAEGYMFFRTIEPFIARANNRSAEAIANVLRPGNPAPPNTLAIVRPALEATYGRLGITPADIGTFVIPRRRLPGLEESGLVVITPVDAYL